MDKNTFISAFQKNSVNYKLPNGDNVVLYELTAGQRGKLNDCIRNKPDLMQVQVVAMSLSFIEDDDLESVGLLPGQVVEEIAEKVLSISGFGEDAEKN